MKAIHYIIPVVLFITSCTKNIEAKKIEAKKLTGSWEKHDLRKQIGNQPEEKYRQTVTFSKDSLVVELFENKKSTMRMSSHYILDTASNVIHYETGNVKVNLRILKLTDTELELLNPNQEDTMKHTRIK